jgi:hypothetical protein
LAGLYNTLLIIKIYVMNPKAFLGYLETGNATSLHPSSHEQCPSNSVGQNELAHGVLQNIPMQVLLSI